jgi:hypothetical protein
LISIIRGRWIDKSLLALLISLAAGLMLTAPASAAAWTQPTYLYRYFVWGAQFHISSRSDEFVSEKVPMELRDSTCSGGGEFAVTMVSYQVRHAKILERKRNSLWLNGPALQYIRCKINCIEEATHRVSFDPERRDRKKSGLAAPSILPFKSRDHRDFQKCEFAPETFSIDHD